MKQVWKKRAVVVSVLLLVCAAVYLNWRYTGGVADTAKVLGQSTLVSGTQEGEDAQQTGSGTAETPTENDYFATARLSRKQARDSAISMLKEAEVDENAEQTVLNEASETLQVLAAYTVAESQIESLVTAKGYADCVAFMGRGLHQRGRLRAGGAAGGGRRAHQGHRHPGDGLHRAADQNHGGKLVVVFFRAEWYNKA